MLKEGNYKEVFEFVQPWLPEIIEVVKKDLKQEHLKIDSGFCKKYFLGKSPNHLTAEELATAYSKDIASGNVGLGEFIATRWLLKHTDIYGFYEARLKAINPDFESIKEIADPIAKTLIEESLIRFGAKKSFLFSLFNAVAFSDAIYRDLKEKAREETKEKSEKEAKEEEAKTAEELKKRYERQMATMNDRFEKKLTGLQKKYLDDVASLKKQVGLLQRKLSDPIDSSQKSG